MSGGTPTILAKILESTREEVERRKREAPVEMLLEKGAPGGEGASGEKGAPGDRSLKAALSGEGIAVIAEIKRRSPSAGAIREGLNVAEVAATYERAGASAISVLTEGPHFGGSLDDLRAARAACSLPILRKDFILDPYQLYEAAAAGAGGVLLIVAALEDEQLESLGAEAERLGLDALVEVHDERELERAIRIGAGLIGVNNRDLRDFSVDVSRTFALLGRMRDLKGGMREDVMIVSESGISSRAQLEELEQAGVHAVLIGETLMRARDPGAALEDLLRRGVPSERAGEVRF